MNGAAVSQETAFMIKADSKCPDGVIRSLRGSACTPGPRLYAERTAGKHEECFCAEAEAKLILMMIKSMWRYWKIGEK